MTETTTLKRDAFPTLLKSWRKRTGISQLDLAMRCDSSQRHISFMESGRSSPSRTMLFVLSEALEIPLRSRNDLFLAAGFAPPYRQTELTAPDLKSVSHALDHILAQQEPYPAYVVDSLYNVLRANKSAQTMQEFLLSACPPESLQRIGGNLMRAIYHPDGYGKYIVNWEESAARLLRRLEAEIVNEGQGEDAMAFLNELESYPAVPKDWRKCVPENWNTPMLPLTVDKDGMRSSVFGTVTTLGSPTDVTLQEIRIEAFFPADDETAAMFQALAG